MRYVGYVRISSEEQRGNYSLDAQKREIAKWVAEQSGEMRGVLAKFYEDTPPRLMIVPRFKRWCVMRGKPNSMPSSFTSSIAWRAIAAMRPSTKHCSVAI
jgi:hypothetical protein